MKKRIRRAKKLKWAVAGCGNFAENTFIPTLLQLKKSILTSVYSSNLNRANFIANKFSATSSFNDYKEFLKQDFDIVYIGSANYNHYWQVLEAAKAGKHILCEKPLALSSQQAKEMMEVSEANNVFLTVNYVHRFHPLAVKTKEILEKAMIGTIIMISASFNIDYKPNDNFRFEKAKSGGGALRDLGTHMIDLLRFFGGEISEVKGFTDNLVYKSEVEDFATGIFKFEKSGYGFINVSFNAQNAFNRIEIIGSNGSISLENIIGKKKHIGKLVINLPSEARKAFRKRANKQLHALRSVQKAILNNVYPDVTAYDGFINMKIMEKLESN